MNDEVAQNDLSKWFSTYGVITAERIFERYQIKLSPDELLHAVKNQHSFYHQILLVPIKNVFNGIIMQQARDYEVYAQKLFIDYLLSGESSKSEDTPGAYLREDLEGLRKNLVRMSEDFHGCELEHYKIIAESQNYLVQLAESWHSQIVKSAVNLVDALKNEGIFAEEKSLSQALITLLVRVKSDVQDKIIINEEVWSRAEACMGKKLTKENRALFFAEIKHLNAFSSTLGKLSLYIDKINSLSSQIRQWRHDFYSLILSANELIKSLPEYRYDANQEQESRESLYFDAGIGD